MIVEPIDQGEILMEWEFDEFEKNHRGWVWYLVAAIVGGFLLVYSIWVGNYIFGVLIVLIAFIYFLYDVHDAPKVRFAITTAGIKVGRKFFKYRDLHDFWIVYHPGEVTNLYFKPSTLTVGIISIPFVKEDPLQIRELLLHYLPESEHEDDEPLSETIGRVLKL